MKTRTVFNDGSPIWLKLTSGLLFTYFAIIVLNVGGGMVVSAFDSPDEILENQRLDSCDRIRAKEEACHGRGEMPCDFGDSPEWHADKFHESIVQCFHFGSQDLTFGVGV